MNASVSTTNVVTQEEHHAAAFSSCMPRAADSMPDSSTAVTATHRYSNGYTREEKKQTVDKEAALVSTNT